MSKVHNGTGAIGEFLAEAEEQLERITLKLSPADPAEVDHEAIHFIYRELHSLKGNAHLFGCHALAQVAHTLESSIDSARKAEQSLSPELSDQLDNGLGLLERMIKDLRDGTGENFSRDMTRLITQLSEIVSRRLNGGGFPPYGKGMQPPPDSGALRSPQLFAGAISPPDPVFVPLATPAAAPPPAPASSAASPYASPSSAAIEPASKPNAQAAVSAITSTPLKGKIQGIDPNSKSSVNAGEQSGQETLRVQVNLLDSLMNLVGELVLVRNQVIRKSNSQAEDFEFVNLSQRLDVITTGLQNEVMKTRMQPIGSVLTKFHRLVRDLSRDLNKDINLKLEGTETELDKTLIEAVKDPLTHIVRNSIDHGIESKNDRALAGKTKTGTVQIRAYHEGGQIVIEVSDDGKGLQRQKIGNKAIEVGLITAEAFKKMSDREVCNLIFLAGFSTADKVSNISGRGVGMDVVRTNIEKIGGVVDISSVEGQGSTIRLKIPLTLAIVPALLIKTGGQSFAIPQVKLTELVRLHKADDHNSNRIERLQGQAVFRLRGSLLPLISLNELLGLDDDALKSNGDEDIISIVVLQADSGVFGVIVDEIDDSTDIVVKSLSGFLKNLNVYSGATVLGDGSVALVLDVAGLAERAKVFSGSRDQDTTAAENVANLHEDITEYLLVDIGIEGRYGIPLFVVNRLEEFPIDWIERTGDQLVVRYRDSILPLIDTASKLSGNNQPQKFAADYCSVIVVQQNGRLYGLIVHQILDIIGMPGSVDESIRDKDCLLGTKIHAGHIISVIDAFNIISKQFPALFTAAAAGHTNHQIGILYAEDNEFFQRQISKMLESAGFKVTCASNGEEAFQRLSADGHDAFDLLVSDLDMPVMDGFHLVEKVRANALIKRLPVVALSSRSKLLTEGQALKAGFDSYIEKSDIARLIDVVNEYASIHRTREVKRGA